RDSHAKRHARMKEGDLGWRASVSTVFPNLSTHGDPRALFVWHPVGPMKMEMWRWFLVDKKAPESVKKAARHFGMRYSGPGGMTEQDDAENWNYATAASKGVIASRHKFNYEQGLGRSKPWDELPGAIISETSPSEQNAREFYRRWAEMMDADSWADLYPV